MSRERRHLAHTCKCATYLHIIHYSDYSADNIKWSATLTPIKVEPFTQQTGPQVNISSLVKEIFFLFFTSSILEHIVVETNRYAAECKGELFERWQPVTLEELCAYMGFMILMGITKLPCIDDYWRKDAVYHYKPVASRITRDRFRELHKYLHFVDNSTLAALHTPGYDKLGKIRPIIRMLHDRFRAVCNPAKEISIDEAMIPFKGRSSLKQYLPMKPIKRGIKIWMRADATTGYVSAFDVYTGKKGSSSEKGLGSRVVKELCEDIYHTYRHIYYDNYFSSVNLALDLFRAGLYSCGTLQSNRKGFPKPLKPLVKKGLAKRGDSKTYQQGNLSVSVWQDNRPVVTISTNSDPTQLDSVQRKSRDGVSSAYSCPQSLSLYNRYMGGVDRNDQLRGYYHVRLKCRKYYKYIFWFLFDLSITNAYILSKHHPEHRRMKVKDFRAALASQLIGSYCSRKQIGRPSLSALPQKRFCSPHFPVKASIKHRCHHCYNNKRTRRETVWHCNDCQLYLCHTGHQETDCFKKYHCQVVNGSSDD